MRTMSNGSSKMTISAEEMRERVVPVARALVEHHEQQGGSRMAAYEAVGRWVGVSASWLRKLIGRQPIDLGAHEYFNLVSAYRAACERIEKAGEREQAKAALIRGVTTDAIVASHLGMALRLTQTSEGGTKEVTLLHIKIPADPKWRERILDLITSQGESCRDVFRPHL